MFFGTIIGLSWTYLFSFVLRDHLLGEFPQNALAFWVWYPFYHLGFVASRWKLPEHAGFQKALPWLILGWAACIGLSILEGWFLSADGLVKFALSQTKATSILMSVVAFAMVLSAYGRLRSTPMRGMAWLGRSSYFVYLTHLFVFAILNRVFALAGLQFSLITHAVVLVIVTTAVCSVGIFIGRRLPSKVQAVVLG